MKLNIESLIQILRMTETLLIELDKLALDYQLEGYKDEIEWTLLEIQGIKYLLEDNQDNKIVRLAFKLINLVAKTQKGN